MLSREYITDKMLKSKPFCICISVLAFFVGFIFIISQNSNTPIDRSEAISYSGEFESYDSYKNYCYINFLNGESYSVYPHTTTNEFEDKMNSLKQGARLYILVNPNNEYVVEVRTANEEILNFETSQKDIASYDNGYTILGIAMCLLSIVFLICILFEIRNKRKLADEIRQKTEDMKSSLEDSAPLYEADFNKKYRTLLQITKDNLQIIYRRRMFVNELVINGMVYDEKRAIIEFPHRLFAKVNGKTIEAGLSENSSSYISVNGKIIKRKKRSIWLILKHGKTVFIK